MRALFRRHWFYAAVRTSFDLIYCKNQDDQAFLSNQFLRSLLSIRADTLAAESSAAQIGSCYLRILFFVAGHSGFDLVRSYFPSDCLIIIPYFA